MNKFYKEYEMLSAYIDGELNESDVKNLEDKLAVSKDLQIKLAELKKLKQLVHTSAEKANKSPYFETKLISQLADKQTSKFNLKKWTPVIGIAAATIILMIFLKSNPQFFEDVIDQQKSMLSGLYKENLRPLFLTAGLTREDVVDFAFYRKLPLDKERGQFLFLGSNEEGLEYFEIKTAGLTNQSYSFEKFVKAFGLSDNQKKQVDSILDYYANEMESQVLVNENNTVAINPKLWKYNNAIIADLMAFAKDANQNQFLQIAPVEFQKMDKPQLVELSNVIKSASDSDYIFFTPDTIFVETFSFDREKFAREMKNLKKELKDNLAEVRKNLQQQNLVFNIDSNLIKLKSKGRWNNNFELHIDTNICRVVIPDLGINVPNFSIPHLEELEAQIDASNKNLKSFSVKVPFAQQKIQKYDFKVNLGDSSKKFYYDFDIKDFRVPFPPNASKEDSSFYNSDLYKFKADSFSKALKHFFNDSMLFDQKEFQRQMQEFQKEMQRLREEMLRLQKDLRREPIKTDKSEPIEI